MSLASDLTLNANAFTGVSAAKTAAFVTSGPGYQSLRAIAAVANTTPTELVIKHQEVKRGKAVYVRSMIGLSRSNVPPTEANPENVLGYSHQWYLVLERPKQGVVTDSDVVTQLAELLSVFGVSLSSGGVPTTNIGKFLARES